MPRIVEPALDFPAHLGLSERHLIEDLAQRNVRAHGDGFVGLILSGSAGRALATDCSDLDVYVVLTDDAAANQTVTRSSTVDEIPISLNEQTAILVAHHRLDGWINFAYRALKSNRDGRGVECRLDAVESVPWLLDVVFTLAGRVRPYNKYLPWELRERPLADWPAPSLLPLLERTIDGDPAAIRESFHRVEIACGNFDARHSSDGLKRVIDGWGTELALFREWKTTSSALRRNFARRAQEGLIAPIG